MADITNLESFLGDVADAIRTKTGLTDPIPAEDFDTEILTISGTPSLFPSLISTKYGKDPDGATTVVDTIPGKAGYGVVLFLHYRGEFTLNTPHLTELTTLKYDDSSAGVGGQYIGVYYGQIRSDDGLEINFTGTKGMVSYNAYVFSGMVKPKILYKYNAASSTTSYSINDTENKDFTIVTMGCIGYVQSSSAAHWSINSSNYLNNSFTDASWSRCSSFYTTSATSGVKVTRAGSDSWGVGILQVIVERYNAGTLDTSDATALPADIAQGKTAYVNGEKIVGNMTTLTETSLEPSQIVESDTQVVTTSNVLETLVIGEGATITTVINKPELADTIGLTCDKILVGNCVLGVDGTAEGTVMTQAQYDNALAIANDILGGDEA